MSQRVGVVLAGGAGRRMGGAKGGLMLAGVCLAQRAAHTLWPFCGSVLISVAPGAGNPAPDWPCVEDTPPAGRGPLAGILAAFEATRQADLLVLACDYPRVGLDLIQALAAHTLDDDDLVMPTDQAGRDHPLVALWSRRIEPLIREALAEGRFRVGSIFPDCRVKRLGPDTLPVSDADSALVNVNWPDDLVDV